MKPAAERACQNTRWPEETDTGVEEKREDQKKLEKEKRNSMIKRTKKKEET